MKNPSKYLATKIQQVFNFQMNLRLKTAFKYGDRTTVKHLNSELGRAEVLESATRVAAGMLAQKLNLTKVA